MSTLRHRIEAGFAVLGLALARNPLKAIGLMLLLALGLASRIPHLVMDTSTEGFLHEEDPVLLEYNAFRDQFGRDEMVAVSIEGEVFDPIFLKRLQALHRTIQDRVPHLDDITSLVNARNTRGQGGELIVEDLLENWPETAAELEALKQRALANPVYRNTLLSDDGRVTAIVIKTDAYSSLGLEKDVMGGFEDSQADAGPRPYLTDAENGELVSALREIVDEHQAEGFKIRMAGSPVVTEVLKRAMQTNMKRFMGLALLTISAVLFLLFRRLSGVLLPLLTVILSLVSTLGLMSLLHIAFKLPTQIMPSFLLAVGVGASVHLLAIFYRRLQTMHFNGDGDGRESRNQAVSYAMGHSGLAIVMTSLTTAAGLASFAGAEIAPISDLGIIAALGVMISLVYTLFLLPPLMAVTPLKARKGERAKRQHERMDDLLTAIADFSVQRRNLVLGISAVLILVGIIGAAQVRFSHTPHRWFSLQEPVRQANDFMDSRMKGASNIEVVVHTGEENGLHDPARMAALASLAPEVEAIEQGPLVVGKTLSVADIIKEINQALHENRGDFYTIPDNRPLIAQELLLFENSGSDDLEDFVDSGFTQARFTIKMPWEDAVLYDGFIHDLESRFHAALGADMQVVVTGLVALLSRTMHATIVSMADSYVIAAAVITLMMILLIGDIKIGLVSMIPNILPILLTLGVMGWLGLPLDLFTILIGSIAIGLAVDDTIHFMHNYRRYHHDTGDVQEAVRRTLTTTGRAMLVTSVVLSLGFFLYMFSELSNLFNFGLLTGITIILALLADFFLAPALMATLHARHLLSDDSDY